MFTNIDKKHYFSLFYDLFFVTNYTYNNNLKTIMLVQAININGKLTIDL